MSDQEERQPQEADASPEQPSEQPAAEGEGQQREQKVYPSIAVRFGKMGMCGEFTHPFNMTFSPETRVVISTDRGIELGFPLHVTCPGHDQQVSRECMQAYTKNSGGDVFRLRNGRILREATEADMNEYRHIEESCPGKINICRRFSEECGLDIKVVDCEQILGGERIVFYFMSEERVDFRELVRKLASEFQTRIEMRQIGARDEARLLADYETCGRECCCKNFLKTLKPVTMSMAKMQKTTLDLAKVSGRCGRLKCCLRYEQDTYDEMNKRLPRNGIWVEVEEGVGRIIDRQILCQLLRLRMADGRMLSVSLDQVKAINVAPPPPPEANGNDDQNGHRGPRRRRPTRGNQQEDASPQNSGQGRREKSAEAGTAEPFGPQDDAQTDSNGGQEGQGNAEGQRPRRRGRRGRGRGRRRPPRSSGGGDSGGS